MGDRRDPAGDTYERWFDAGEAGNATSRSATVGRSDLSLAPTRPPGLVPRCDCCAEAAVELRCDCCGQEQCRSCWADGDHGLCGACRGRVWDDVPPEESVMPVGLLAGYDDIIITDEGTTAMGTLAPWGT